MSLFLGKIHYWLFNKILWFEKLEDEIIEINKELESKKINIKESGSIAEAALKLNNIFEVVILNF